MTYKLDFYEEAYKEWKKPDKNISDQFKQKLVERLKSPRVPSAKLRDSKDRYKIKLKGVGYRLVYEVNDKTVVVLVVARYRLSLSWHNIPHQYVKDKTNPGEFR